MLIIAYPDDLAHDYKGKVEDAKLNDFPVIENMPLGPFDCVILRYGSTTRILRPPIL
jgi:hypothetical protein